MPVRAWALGFCPPHPRPGGTVRRLALRLGRDGRIVSPRDLADSAREAAREALAAYDGVEALGAHGTDAGPEGRRDGQDGQYDRQEQGL